MNVLIVKGGDAYKTTKQFLDKIKFKLKDKRVLIKPNLATTASSQDGITTDVNVVRAVLEKLENCNTLIGEGASNTLDSFKLNGYFDLARDFNVKLVDFDKDEIVNRKIPKPFHFNELPFAKTALECEYLINIAKLKVHSYAKVTLCLKNLFGTVISRKNRILIHPFIQKAVCDIIQVIRSDFNIIDGIVGNQRDECISNPVMSNIIIGGYDILSVDIVGSQCMGINPKEIEHLVLAEKLLGKREINLIGEKIENVKKDYDRRPMLGTKIRYRTEDLLRNILKRF